MAHQYPSNILTPCLQTDQQLLVLVKPSFGSGAFGHCSVWIGVNDRKLYVRKLMTTHPKVHKPPKDIAHHPNLPMVPKLVTWIRHEPVPVRVGELGAGKFMTTAANTKQFWSAIYEYVPGCDLGSIVNEAINMTQPLPEPMIWKFGQVMLDFLEQLLFPDGAGVAGNHNDLHGGNILVSNDVTGDGSCNFHVIDFGLATGEQNANVSSKDLRDVCIALRLMMRCHLPEILYAPIVADPWGRGGYLSPLEKALGSLYRLIGPWQYRKKEHFSTQKRYFEKRARDATKRYQKEGRACGVDVSGYVIEPNPICWRDEAEPLRCMSEGLRDQTGVYPCQRAWAHDSGPVENWTIERQVLWGNPVLDPPHHTRV